MKLDITVEIWEKGKRFVARCPELDFVSQGKTPYEAKKNLLDVIEIQFEEMTEMGTLEAYLSECGLHNAQNFTYRLENSNQNISVVRMPVQA